MIQDISKYGSRELPDYDICIIGSGPAGMTVAAELVGQGLRVCVLESGLTSVNEHGDSLRVVKSNGIKIKEYSRERVLGGTSTTWAGLSAPLDEIDFAPRPWLSHSSWPISREELAPFWEAAAERYRFPPSSLFEASGGFGHLRRQSGFRPRWHSITEKIFLAASESQNFGKEWKHIFEGEGHDAWLDATVVELLTDDTGRRVTAAKLRSRNRQGFRLNARIFVIATGGIENARLLLNSRSSSPSGLGNQHDQVGRYLMNHPKNYHGMLHLSKPTGDLPFYYGCLYKGFAGYAGLRLSENYQAENKLLNSYVRLEPLFPWTDSEGVEALVILAKHSAFLMRRFTQRKSEELVALRDYSETGDDSDLQNARKSLFEWIQLAFKIPLHLPSVLKYLQYRLITKAKPRIKSVRLRNFMEMEPHPNNRVTVTEDLDELGVRCPQVEHDSTEADRRSMIELHEVLTREFQEQGFGRLETSLGKTKPWPIDQEASHHLGTTRMGEDPKTSVVNTNCRLHHTENLFVAGGSVFPTSGCANPTYTIVALSIRLAQHLANDVFKKQAPST